MSARALFFSEDVTLSDKFSHAIDDISRKPGKMSLLFWFYFLQACLALFLLLGSVLLPIWLLW